MNKRYIALAVDKVVFPRTVGMYSFGNMAVIKTLKEASVDNDKIILVPKQQIEKKPTQKTTAAIIEKLNGEVSVGDYGTIVDIEQILSDPFEFEVRLAYKANYVVKITDVISNDGFCSVEASKLKFESCKDDDNNYALYLRAKQLLEEYVKTADLDNYLINNFTPENAVEGMYDVVGKMPSADKMLFFSATTLEQKLLIFISLLTSSIEFQIIDDNVADKVKDAIDQNQREYYVREQIRALTQEIDGEDETEEYNKKIDALNASDDIKAKLRKEARRINQTAPASPEMAILKNYLDTVLELPWGIITEDNEDLKQAEDCLNEDHYGMEKVKERLIEALAVRKLSKEGRSPIICLVGPPGIGKTSIARSIARAMNKKYVRLSFGGVRDEAEIRGHRKTYVGAMPGRIITGIKTAGSMNPVFLMDEIDKMASDYKGDPASALLEVLDPEQNVNFRDHFIEMPFDLSKVLFIVTANSLDTISRPLLDRMEIIEMGGYTDLEKLEIAKQHLIRKSYKQNGVQSEWASFTDEAILKIIKDYTRESGVRGLEKEICAVMRKIARKFVDNQDTAPIAITEDNLVDYLGEQKFINSDIAEEDVGVVNGLAWTSVGGDTLSIEVVTTPGKGDVLLTGNLGDVMKESARIALTYCRGVAREKFGLEPSFFKENDIHIHVPEGATPKDGPSAGITMATAIASALAKKTVKGKIAMTGELTLRGKVLPIGGLKEKTLAAVRGGIKKVFIPEENKKDYSELPKEIKDQLEFVFVNNVNTVLDNAINW